MGAVGSVVTTTISSFFFVAALLVACGSGNASNSRGGETGASSDAGGTCTSCSVDSDCRNSCPTASRASDVWCCGFGMCFTWANACPALTVDAGNDNGPQESGSDADEN